MPTILYDDLCESCKGWAGFIKKRSKGKVRLIGQETEEGRRFLGSKPKNLEGVDSVFLVDKQGNWHSKSTAALRIAMQLSFPWPIFILGLLIPRPIRDYVYDSYAKRRFRGTAL